MGVGSKNNLLYFFKYDVFLCFHSEDTGEGFTGYLRDALLENRLKTSTDVQLQKDRPISKPIEEILKSRLSVVIFSENFASSESCLEELAMILECREALGLEVLPIFYKVKISELRDQVVGKTAVYLAAHDKRHGGNSHKVARWRNAVRDFGGLSGYPRRPGVELDFIQEIVKAISEKLRWKNRMRRRTLQAFDLLWIKIAPESKERTTDHDEEKDDASLT